MSEDRLIWFKNNLVPAAEAMVPVLSPTAQFGLNVFEGIRGYWGGDDIHVFRYPEHYKRLEQSCRLIGLECPYSEAEILGFIRDVVKANDFKCDIALRVTVFVDGEGSWISDGPLGMFIAPIERGRTVFSPDLQNDACISTWTRINDTAFPPRVKLGANYINSRYAMNEAHRNGYQFPILLGSDGKVAEGTGACLFAVRDGKLITPDVTSSILESITRETMITLAEDAGFEVTERRMDRTELYLADELFLCGSAAEVTPLTSLDRRRVGDGKIGAITKALHDAYLLAASGPSNAHADWRTPIYSA